MTVGKASSQTAMYGPCISSRAASNRYMKHMNVEPNMNLTKGGCVHATTSH